MPISFNRTCRLLVATSFITAVLGCGNPTANPPASGPPNTSPPPSAHYADLTGNWDFGPYYKTGLTAGAALSTSGGQITGLLHLLQSQCLPGARRGPLIQYANLAITGTLDTKNNISFQASSAAGSTLSANGIVSSDGSSISLGSFSIHEVCADSVVKDNSGASLNGSRIPSATGSWSGTVTFDQVIGYGTTVPTVTVTEQLTQSDTPDLNGFFPVTGTLTVKGSDCITVATGSGFITGGSGFVSFGDQTSALFSLPVEGLQATSFHSEATLEGSKCGYREGDGQLTRQ
jgi:hypothetical protein